MKRWLVTACFAALTVAAIQPARAQSAMELLDRGSDFAARIDPVVLADGAAFTRSLGGDVAMLANLVTLGSVGILAFDVLEARGWQSLGIDSGKGVWLSYSVATERDQLHQVRVVARLLPGSQSAFDNWLLRLLRLETSWMGKGPGLSKLLGTANKQSLAAIRRHKPILVGRRGKVRIVVRADKDRRIFDIVWPYGVQDWEWSDQGKALLDGLTLPKKSDSLAAHDSVSLKAATSAPIGLWLRSGSLAKLDAASVIAPRQCERLDNALRQGPVDELALTIGPPTRPNKVQQTSLSVVWRMTDVQGVHRALTSSDKIIRPKASTAQAFLLLNGANGLRALNRAALFHEQGWAGTWRLARQCGPGHRFDLYAFHLLDLAGQWLDDVAATSKTANTIVEAIGPVAVSLNMLGTTAIPIPILNVEAAVEEPGADALTRLFDNVFPARRVREGVTVWGKRRLKPYRRGSLVGAQIGNVAAADIEIAEISDFSAKQPIPLFGRIYRPSELLAILATLVSPGLATSLRSAANRWQFAQFQLSFDDQALRLELTL